MIQHSVTHTIPVMLVVEDTDVVVGHEGGMLAFATLDPSYIQPFHLSH